MLHIIFMSIFRNVQNRVYSRHPEPGKKSRNCFVFMSRFIKSATKNWTRPNPLPPFFPGIVSLEKNGKKTHFKLPIKSATKTFGLKVTTTTRRFANFQKVCGKCYVWPSLRVKGTPHRKKKSIFFCSLKSWPIVVYNVEDLK